MKKRINLINALLFCLIFTPYVACSEEQPKEVLLETSDGNSVNVSPSEKGITVYEWFNPECPFVQKIYKNGFMPKLQEEYIAKGAKWFVVSSTNKSHRDFVPKDKRAELKTKMGIQNALMVYDEDGDFGKANGAKTTPHIFVFKNQKLVYSGAIDDSPETESEPALAEKNYLKLTLDALLSASPVEKEKTRPYGCPVKY